MIIVLFGWCFMVGVVCALNAARVETRGMLVLVASVSALSFAVSLYLGQISVSEYAASHSFAAGVLANVF